ncbi:MAG: aldo/keto reductase [Gemmatimonadetes bacterium]|nr:aldo/keto reductase [Gemmatimonadota bacterium]
MSFQDHRVLGRTGVPVSRIGLAGGYGVPAKAVERAFQEYGINYFYWVSRKPGMKEALRALGRSRRNQLVIAAQSYTRSGLFLARSVEKALRELETDYLDVLFLGWFNRMPSSRLLDRARELKEQGKVRFLGVTGHNRRFHGELARKEAGPFEVLQVRYSAAHRGAESDVFQDLPPSRPGITTYTATRWGKLLKARKMPPGEAPLTAAECYRFALSHPAVDLCIAGPRTEEQMLEGFEALSDGPLGPEEMERVRRIGDFVHG